mmetsp:Transcript_14934/g.22472  ORF Transcript_14934/g.22472 Transcript_14934/m.22472 type:complete len:423 (-) Transcript_14934:184-1452(-)|eukprot:CAMPEP_0185027634 /NCGR_PEP_ID=MMETSP1103-20130426/12888_1 /TAXON_ID=36769 /ORGANISM="Paraphysomonas bandaiensis, Strain Caron Lab Isolate" /LENGTH=422 /DNA_ID=CAMNT_0027561729 /DNA_START=32 /DNA_END=1300 /DNA_ORIENTATION=+
MAYFGPKERHRARVRLEKPLPSLSKSDMPPTIPKLSITRSENSALDNSRRHALPSPPQSPRSAAVLSQLSPPPPGTNKSGKGREPREESSTNGSHRRQGRRLRPLRRLRSRSLGDVSDLTSHHEKSLIPSPPKKPQQPPIPHAPPQVPSLKMAASESIAAGPSSSRSPGVELTHSSPRRPLLIRQGSVDDSHVGLSSRRADNGAVPPGDLQNTGGVGGDLSLPACSRSSWSCPKPQSPAHSSSCKERILPQRPSPFTLIDGIGIAVPDVGNGESKPETAVFETVLSGPKLFWRRRMESIITVYDHTGMDCFEVLTVDVKTRSVVNRLYIRPSTVSQYQGKEFAAKLHTITSLRKDLLERATRSLCAEYVMDAIEIDRELSTKDTVVMGIKRFNGETAVMETLNIPRPPDLIPVPQDANQTST